MEKLTFYDRQGALTYKYLNTYDAAFAKKWAIEEYGAEKCTAFDEWMAEHPEDIAPQERSAAICRANYTFFAYTYAKTRDPKLMKEISAVSALLGKAESELQHFKTVSNQDGGMKVYIGDSQL